MKRALPPAVWGIVIGRLSGRDYDLHAKVWWYAGLRRPHSPLDPPTNGFDHPHWTPR